MSLVYTPNYGSIPSKNIQFAISNTKLDNIPFTDFNKNGNWFIACLQKWSFGGMAGQEQGTIGLVDNYGRLWQGGAGSQTIQGGYTLEFKKMSDGVGCAMPDEVIDTLLKIKTNYSHGPDVATSYSNFLLCAEQAMGWAHLKIQHATLNTELEELKKNVEQFSNDNDKLMSIIHKNRWNMLF
jgi:hypothetical protein